MVKKLILFDIDGTLVHTGGAGTRSLNQAFKDVFGIESAFRNIPMAGKTDPLIVRTALRAWDLDDTDQSVELCLSRYVELLADEIARSNGRRVLPGIETILARLGTIDGVVVGLLTGNIEQGARIKLEAMNLWSHFRLGAYGSDREDRNDLVFVAIERYAAATGESITTRETVVVGDTPRDISCSKPFGATAVAVATGPYGIEDLRVHKPDALFEDLGDGAAFFDFLGLPLTS